MNPYYLTNDLGNYAQFTNGGYSSAGSNTSSPAGAAGAGGSSSNAAATSSTNAQANASGSSGPSLLAGPLVHPHQDLNEFLESFWTRQMGGVEQETPDFKTYNLPLARIKKVMKSDEEVKMISAEGEFQVVEGWLRRGGQVAKKVKSGGRPTAPIMFSKACEIFISELTCRAWLVAEGHKRRTLQKSDVASAIAFSDVFDFLIDIVPRDEGGNSNSNSNSNANANTTAAEATSNGAVDGAVDHDPHRHMQHQQQQHQQQHVGHMQHTQESEWTQEGEYDEYDGQGYDDDGRDGEALYSEYVQGESDGF